MNRIPNPDIEVPDEKVAMAFFRSIRWVNGVYCPKCKSYNINNRGIHLARTVDLISMISPALFSTKARFLLE